MSNPHLLLMALCRMFHKCPARRSKNLTAANQVPFSFRLLRLCRLIGLGAKISRGRTALGEVAGEDRVDE